MSSASRRTWQKHHVGPFHITVEAEPPMTTLAKESSPQKLKDHRGVADITKELIAVLDSHRLPATWAVGDPAHSATTALVTLSAVPHEMALLGDHHWVGPTAGRTRFARELARRVSQARAQGLEVVTIVPRVAPIAEHIDLIVKQDIRAVVEVANDATERTRPAQTRALHYGVWEFSASQRLPMESSPCSAIAVCYVWRRSVRRRRGSRICRQRHHSDPSFGRRSEKPAAHTHLLSRKALQLRYARIAAPTTKPTSVVVC